MRRPLPALAVTVLAVLPPVLAGCGGSGGGTASGTAAATATSAGVPLAAWQERMRSACTNFQAPANVGVPAVAVRTIHRAIAELRAIGMPDERAAEARELFAVYDEMEAITRQVAAGAATAQGGTTTGLSPALSRRLLTAGASLVRLTQALDIVPCAHIGRGRTPSPPEPTTTG